MEPLLTFLSKLDVYNAMLASLGEAPLNTEDEGHPLLPAAQRALTVASYRVQARSWWFNTELTTLRPDADSGYIVLPNDIIRVDPREPCLSYVQRGRRLYDPNNSRSADKYKFDREVTCWLVRHLDFDELPLPAQMAVSYAAQVDFQLSYDADRLKLQQLSGVAQESLVMLNAEHIRNMDVNLLHTPSVAATMARVSPGLTYR